MPKNTFFFLTVKSCAVFGAPSKVVPCLVHRVKTLIGSFRFSFESMIYSTTDENSVYRIKVLVGGENNVQFLAF